MQARPLPTTGHLLLGLAATCLWFGASLFKLSTPVEIYSDGGRIEVTVAGSTLTAPVGISALETIELEVMDAVEPPGGRYIELRAEDRLVFHERLPRRFKLPRTPVSPLGDWEIDEQAGKAVVFRRPANVDGPFTLRAELTGRYLHAATLRLDGAPSTAVVLRRGLINNDMFVLDHDGAAVAATSIDPRPLSSIAAILATLMRSASAACLLMLTAALLRGPVSRLLPSMWSSRSPPSPAFSFQCLIVALIAVAATALSAWVAADVLAKLPHQPDSVTYLLQAKWITGGALSTPVPEIPASFDLPFMHEVGDRWVAHYPPGWPVLLAMGLAVGTPWLVAPLLGGLFIGLLFLTGRELFSPGVGLAAAVLGFISPLSTVLFASQLSHGACATAVLLSTWLILRSLRTGYRWQALAGGMSLGIAFAMRPLTALAVASIFMILLADRGSRMRRDIHGITLSFAAGGLLACLPTLVANHVLTGSVLRFPYALADGTMYGWRNVPFGLMNLDAILTSAAPSLFGWGWGWITGTAALAIPFALAWVPLVTRRPGRRELFLVGLYLAVAVAHIGAQASGLHGFGPRYHFEVFAVLYLLTARGFQLLARAASVRDGLRAEGHASTAGTAVAALLFVVLCSSTVFTLGQRLELYRGYNGVSGCLEEQIEAMGLRYGLVLFSNDDWQNWAEASRLIAADLEGELIFATMQEDDENLLRRFGDRPIYVWDGVNLLESR